MTSETRAKYVEYIAEAMWFAEKETSMKWPDETIVVVKSFSELSEIDEIIGLKIYVTDMPSSYEFFIAFPSRHEKEYGLQKAFGEYQELYPMAI